MFSTSSFSRRSFAQSLLVAGALLVVPGVLSATAARADDAKETRTVDTDKGPVEIPVDPQAIVSDYYLGELLALGTKPIIASPYALNNPFLEGMTDGIEALNTSSAETSLEMIAEKQPDLIITITEADYDKYSQIAPTIYIEDGKRTDEELFLYIADLLGKTDEAQAYLDDFNQKVEDAKDEINQIVGDRTVSIVEVWPQQVYVMGDKFARGGTILFDMWGLKAPEKVEEELIEGDNQYEVVSMEALPDYVGDFILYGVLDGADDAFVEDSLMWQNLDAVKEGRVLPYEQIAYMHRDPITLSGQLEDFLEFFRGVAKAEGIEVEASGDKESKDSGDDAKASDPDAKASDGAKTAAEKPSESQDDAKASDADAAKK